MHDFRHRNALASIEQCQTDCTHYLPSTLQDTLIQSNCMQLQHIATPNGIPENSALVATLSMKCVCVGLSQANGCISVLNIEPLRHAEHHNPIEMSAEQLSLITSITTC